MPLREMLSFSESLPPSERRERVQFKRSMAGKVVLTAGATVLKYLNQKGHAAEGPAGGESPEYKEKKAKSESDATCC